MNLFESDRRQLDRIERLLIAIARNSNLTISTEKEIMASVADIQAEADDVLTRVTANTNALDAVKTLIQSQSDQINTLNQELKDAIANGADPAALQAISDKLTAVTQATDAQAAAEATLANTAPPAGTGGNPNPPDGNLPVVTSLTPNNGPSAGGSSIVINGTGFTGASAVNFGGTIPATSFDVTSDTTINAIVPPNGVGPSDVEVTTANGTSVAVLFAYV